MFADRFRLERSPRHGLALDCVQTGIEAAHPERVIRESVRVDGESLVVADRRVDLSGVDRLLALDGGKAAGTAAAALEGLLAVDGGVVVTDTPANTERVEVREGSHPIPEERNVAHTGELLALARSATADDLVLAPITGGGSALLAAPIEGIGLDDLQATTEGLLESGATIGEINAVRRRLSAVKGGGLARATAPATVVGIVFSDVVGNDLSMVASGLTAPAPATGDALAVLNRYDVTVPAAVRESLATGGNGSRTGATSAAGATNVVVADGLTALDAAARTAAERGYEPLVLSGRIRGEAREAAKTHVAVAEECLASGRSVEPPAVVLSGGEVTVAGPGDSVGGPNLEFGLSAALELEVGVLASVDTDGIDGSSPAAGALVDGDTVADPDRARDALDSHASYEYLAVWEAAVETGPTGTNVNDLRVLVVDS